MPTRKCVCVCVCVFEIRKCVCVCVCVLFCVLCAHVCVFGDFFVRVSENKREYEDCGHVCGW